MEHLTSRTVERRVNPPSIEEVAPADTPESLVAKDVETRVGADQGTSRYGHSETHMGNRASKPAF